MIHINHSALQCYKESFKLRFFFFLTNSKPSCQYNANCARYFIKQYLNSDGANEMAKE